MSGGGEQHPKDLPYKAPVGPKGIDNSGPGLGGHNCGNAGVQGPYPSRGDGSSGRPGLGGTNHGNTGTQGRR